MPDVVIRVENLAKRYRLGLIGRTALHEDLSRWWARLCRREDPTLKVDLADSRVVAGAVGRCCDDDEHVWALRDVSFEVRRGQVLGIIGRNGAGKSTLLKILSRVTAPTRGCVKVKGRIASLLEVGTGFHPELTGKENIFLNGAILGMTKAAIAANLDEIIAFSGCERYIDTPVKRYSSGMYVRLAFAVAAHLEVDILIVDEVLAVGDAEFQKKCLGKMQDVAGHGRTVLFVSHNMSAIRMLCQDSVLLDQGRVEGMGPTEGIIARYSAGLEGRAKGVSLAETAERTGSLAARFVGFSVEHQSGASVVVGGEPVQFMFSIRSSMSCKAIDIGFSLHDTQDAVLSVLYSSYQNQVFDLEANETRVVKFTWDPVSLSPGIYTVRGRMLVDGVLSDWPRVPLGTLTVEMGDFYGSGSLGFRGRTVFLMKGTWQ